jgi:hypothetical protein
MVSMQDARHYNDRRSRSLWESDELPWPLSTQEADSPCFAQLVAMFQG